MLKVMDINLLKAHEEVDKSHVQEIKEALLKDSMQIEPILVENKHNIILDGHHRVEALKDLGFTKIAAYLVSYDDVKLDSWRPEIKLEKAQVIKNALQGKLFPPRTTKHIFDGKPVKANVDLKHLK